MKADFLFFNAVERQRVQYAYNFAYRAHYGQLRKWTDPPEPYVNHVDRVAATVSKVANRSTEMIIAAMLHDTLEDTKTTATQIREHFGPEVEWAVQLLTDPDHSAGNRATRQNMTVVRLREAPWQVKTIKLADMLDNITDIFERDSNFAKVYVPEKLCLIDSLRDGDQKLWNTVWVKLQSQWEKLQSTALPYPKFPAGQHAL